MVFTILRPYWTASDPPYVESDGGSDGQIRGIDQPATYDRWRQRSLSFERGDMVACGWPWLASNPGVGRSDGPINASPTVTYVTQRLNFVGASI